MPDLSWIFQEFTWLKILTSTLMPQKIKSSDLEDRISLFGAQLVDNALQSSTIRYYISAIKAVLVDDRYAWDDHRVLLSTLVRLVRVLNDKVYIRLPIHIKLLELMLFKLQRIFSTQPYLQVLYKAIFSIAYNGMFRIGEITKNSSDNHVVKACDVHKNKMQFTLYSSKTHGKKKGTED